MNLFKKIAIAVFIQSTIYSSVPSLSALLNNLSSNAFNNYEVKGMIMNAHTSESFKFNMAFKNESKGLFVSVKTPLNESNLQMNHSLEVIESSFKVKDPELIKKINYDERLAIRNQWDEVVFSFYLNKNKVREKGVYYTKNTLDTFSIIPVLQHLSASPVDAFSADFSIQHMATKVPVLIQKITTNYLLPFFDGYALPKKLENHIRASKKQYIIYVLSVKGWQGLIYNHRHYYVFSSDAPHPYIGHWGGQDKTNLFSWAINP